LITDLKVDAEAGTATITYECRDNVAVTSCELEIFEPDGTFVTSDQPPAGTFGGAFTFTPAESGTYTAVVTADDGANEPAVVTETFTILRFFVFCPLYNPDQSKNVGTNYSIRIEPCDPSLVVPLRQLELMAYLITDPATGERFDPGVNDSGSANDDELYLFRNVKKDGFTYNLNTTDFLGTPSSSGTEYLIWFEVKNAQTGATIGIGNAPFTLTP